MIVTTIILMRPLQSDPGLADDDDHMGRQPAWAGEQHPAHSTRDVLGGGHHRALRQEALAA